jgi:hypothetical protein
MSGGRMPYNVIWTVVGVLLAIALIIWLVPHIH